MCVFQMAQPDEDDDPVVQEVDVFLSKQLSDHLYVFQYPVRPTHMKYDDIPHLSARIKPQQQKVRYHQGTTSCTHKLTLMT